MVEILELHGRYSFAADEGDPDDYAAVFTEDGAFVGRVGQPDEIRVAGRDALRKFATRARANREIRRTRHHQSSPVFIELDETTALTRTYLMVTVVEGGQPPALGLTSIYEDRLVKTEEGWRIKERRALPDVKGRLR